MSQVPPARPPISVLPSPEPRGSRFVEPLLLSGLLGVGLAVALYVLRAPLARSVLLGITTMVAVFLLTVLAGGRSWNVPTRPIRVPARHQSARWQVDRYERLLYRPADFSEPIRLRLRGIVEGVLRRMDCEFDSPRARQLLGEGPHQLLSAVPKKPPQTTQLRALADAVQHLLSTNDSASPPPKGPQ